jgi:hypothetical protein
VHWYRVYGQLLASDLAFPELRAAAPGTPAWTFRVGPPVAPPGFPDSPPLGRQPLYPECDARLFRLPEGWRVVVDDTGVYDLTDGGRVITWRALPGSSPDFTRGHLLGRVLATSMHFAGAVVLHGSAVSYPPGGVVFLAPKHTGKSTLALALTLAGARLISDDTITLTLPEQGPPDIWPGVHSLRLLPDAAARLAVPVAGGEREDGKQLVSDLPAERLEEAIRPLQAVYLLGAAADIRDGAAVARSRLAAPLAAAVLVGQGKVSEMLGQGEAETLLQRAARVVSRIPVYQLAVLRDLDRLPEVVSRLAAWHDAPAENPS